MIVALLPITPAFHGQAVTYVVQTFIPPLIAPVLEDYRGSIPQARDAEVLHLLEVVCSKMAMAIGADAPTVRGADRSNPRDPMANTESVQSHGRSIMNPSNPREKIGKTIVRTSAQK